MPRQRQNEHGFPPGRSLLTNGAEFDVDIAQPALLRQQHAFCARREQHDVKADSQYIGVDERAGEGDVVVSACGPGARRRGPAQHAGTTRAARNLTQNVNQVSASLPSSRRRALKNTINSLES